MADPVQRRPSTICVNSPNLVILGQIVHEYKCNYGDPAEKFDPGIPTFRVTQDHWN